MDLTTALLRTEAAEGAPALLLRPWDRGDAPRLARAHRDPALRRWATAPVHDEASATRWIQVQRDGWDSGDRYAFAVVEPAPAEAELVGHVALKRTADGAEVGYWTAAHARGRAVAPRALRALTEWAFASFGLSRLDLLHQTDNTASCRVAQKAGYALCGLLPAAPPDFPLPGHLHTRVHTGA
ncbi:GNAT family N-acetyltransferase [Streptomyces sp. Ru71]|uniref:GNAT family N-acetyltransferase n=1 Tax=Streptomyces sp. Ru71 TaxID=2080746 RepID=UPI000CDDEA08|nr:GNAT family N-acetyltransferase [Streptomyces sp. Ru71]POX48779.1 GNAT family N-acetyltransferase [Streptomyces sp. Ru71]